MSTKTSNQPGRRTPLSLSGGGVTKGGQSNNKGGNANGHHANNHKQDNKNQQHNKTELQQQQLQQQLQTNNQKPVQAVDTKENPSKNQNKQTAATDSKIPKPQQQSQQNTDNSKTQKQQQHNDKKQAAVAEKQQQQNGVPNNNNNKTSGNQQSQQQEQQQQQQNGNDVKLVEKDKKAAAVTQEKPEKEEKEKNKSQDKPGKAEKQTNKTQDKPVEKVDKEKNETQEKHDDKKSKEDKKVQDSKKDSKNAKEDKKVTVDKKEEKSENANENTNTIENETKQELSVDQQVVEQMDVVAEPKEVQSQLEQQKQDNQKSAPSTPKSLRDSKSQTPNKATPTKAEKSVQKSTPPTKREVTTAIDDVDMEPLAMDPPSPIKEQVRESIALALAPCATSTPGKALLPKPTAAKTDVQLAMQASVTPERPRAFSQISGRRAIRPITDYTPSKFQSNPQFRESYRRINTELDATNTSLNVTVGSEVPNNASFSFFGRGRKRDRTPPQHSQSAIGELQTEMEISPPKRARLDFFSVVSSPLSMLRNRFSRTTLQSSTPVKLQQKLEEKEDDIEVQNVSGVSVHEDIDKSADESAAEGEASFGEEVTADKTPVEGELEIGDNGAKELPLKSAAEKQISEDGDIKITETPLLSAEGDPVAKNKRCVVM